MEDRVTQPDQISQTPTTSAAEETADTTLTSTEEETMPRIPRHDLLIMVYFPHEGGGTELF